MNQFLANGFCSTMPPGWEDRSTISLVGPTSSDGFASNIVVTRQALPMGTTATQFGRQQLDALPDQVDEITVEDQRTATYNERELFQSIHQIRVGTQTIRQVQTYLVASAGTNTEGLVITGSASPAAFDEVAPHFRQFVESFELIDPQALQIQTNSDNE